MTKPQDKSLDEQLPGLRIAFFEIIWQVFRWIESIWIKESKGQFQVFVRAAAAQDEKEWDDFDYLAGRVFKSGERVLDELAPNSKHKIEYTIHHGPAVPKDGYRELMSDRVFKIIAKKHASWRLEDGR